MPKLFAESVTETCDMLASSTPSRIEINLTQKYVFKSPIPFKEKGTEKPVNSKVTFHLNGAGLIERHDEEYVLSSFLEPFLPFDEHRCWSSKTSSAIERIIVIVQTLFRNSGVVLPRWIHDADSETHRWDHETNKQGDEGFMGKVQAFRKKADAKVVEKTVPSDPSKV